MNVASVDPRDQSWEVDEPSCRVYFHEDSGASDEHQIDGADVDEVVSWADRQSAGRRT